MVGERKANFYRYQRDHGFAGRLSGSNAQRKIKSGRREAEAVVDDFRKGSLSGPKAMEKVTDLFKAQKIDLSTVRSCARKISPNGEISPKNLSLESINRGLLFNEFNREEGLNSAIYALLQNSNSRSVGGVGKTNKISEADEKAIKELVENRLAYSQKNFSSKLLNKSAAVAKFTGKTTAQTAYTTSKLLGRSAKNTWNKIVGNELGYSSGSMVADEMSGSAKRSMYQITGTMKHAALAPVTSTMRQVQLYHRMKRDTAREKEIKQAVSDVKAGKTNSEKGTTSSKAVRNVTTKLNSSDVAFKAKLGVKSKLGVVGHSAQDLGKRVGKAGRKTLMGSPASLTNFSGRQMSKMTSEAFGQTDQTLSSLGSAANKLVFQKVMHPVRTTKRAINFTQRMYRIARNTTRVITRVVKAVAHAIVNLFSALLSNPIGWGVLAFAALIVIVVGAVGSCIAVATPLMGGAASDYEGYVNEDELEDGYSSVEEFMTAADNLYTQAENDLYNTVANCTEADVADYLNTGVLKISHTSTSSSSSGGIVKSNADELRQQLVDYSLQFLGCTRVTGGRGDYTIKKNSEGVWVKDHDNSPGHYEFDCSGLTQYVYLHALEDYGISIDFGVEGGAWDPGTQYLYSGATNVENNLSSLKPGDLIFFNLQNDTGLPGHVGMYIGSYQGIEHAYIEASTTGYIVKISDYGKDQSTRDVVGIKRLILDSGEGSGATGTTGSGQYTADNIVIEINELNTPYHNPYCLMSYMCAKYGQNWKMADMEYESDMNNEDSIFNYQYDAVFDVSSGTNEDGKYTALISFHNNGFDSTVRKLWADDSTHLDEYMLLCYYYGNPGEDETKYYWPKSQYKTHDDEGITFEMFASGYYSSDSSFSLDSALAGSSSNYDQGGVIVPSTSGFIWPLKNIFYLSSHFGYRDTGIEGASHWHRGIDISNSQYGATVMCVYEGTVEKVVIGDKYNGGRGIYVVVRHDYNGSTVYSLYQHLQSVESGIYEGLHVKQGATLGYVGATGIGSGPHLHLEIHENYLDLSAPDNSNLLSNVFPLKYYQDLVSDGTVTGATENAWY